MHRHLVGRGRTIWQAEVIDENHWIRVEKGRKEFFVKWVGLPITRCEWKLPQDIEHAREKIEAFEPELSARARPERGSARTAAELRAGRNARTEEWYIEMRWRYVASASWNSKMHSTQLSMP
jgi:hypothetical protein